jgi:transcriptional regulator with XRE-family HTH domain
MVYNPLMLSELAAELRRAREQLGVSLQAIADPAKISVAYLQKLERGLVGSPSPHVLRRVASSAGVPYLRLMELAGYLDEDEVAAARERETTPRPHPLAEQKLSQGEWRAVGAFIKVLTGKRTERSEPGA